MQLTYVCSKFSLKEQARLMLQHVNRHSAFLSFLSWKTQRQHLVLWNIDTAPLHVTDCGPENKHVPADGH